MSKTQLYKNSFLPSIIYDWNKLPIDTQLSSSLAIFKSKLNRNIRKPPIHFLSGDRQAQILHTRLRLGCSSLNHDLFRKSISQTPHCSCGEIETTSHYLLSCRIYQRQRLAYFNGLPCPLTFQNLIYGCERLTFEENKHVFYQVQRFIIATRRFTA